MKTGSLKRRVIEVGIGCRPGPRKSGRVNGPCEAFYIMN